MNYPPTVPGCARRSGEAVNHFGEHAVFMPSETYFNPNDARTNRLFRVRNEY